MAMRNAADASGHELSDHLASTMRCIRGLAWAERRRRGLLVERWRQFQGASVSFPASLASPSRPGVATPVPAVTASSSPVAVGPQSCSFSPPRALDWDLDDCRTKGTCDGSGGPCAGSKLG